MKRINRRILIFLLALVVIGTYTVGYLTLLAEFTSSNGLSFSPYFQDNVFAVGNSAWSNSSMSSWNFSFIPGLSSSNAIYTSSQGVGTISLNFSGRNMGVSSGVTAASIRTSIPNVDTAIAWNLLVTHKETSASTSLSISYALRDTQGEWHYSGFFPTSTNWTELTRDTRSVFKGVVTAIQIKFSDDSNSSYVGGIQNSSIRMVALEEPREWEISFFSPPNSVPAQPAINSTDSELELFARGHITSGTIVSGQRYADLPKIVPGSYLIVMVKTSSIGVAARVVIWSAANTPTPILLQTYDDSNWHKVIISLDEFHLTNLNLFLIELGMLQLYPSTNAVSFVSFGNLTFSTLQTS